MNLNFFTLIFFVTFSAQSIAALNNPFGKVSNLDVDADIQWNYQKGLATKISDVSDNDDIFYELNVAYSKLTLRLVDSSSTDTAKALSFEQLSIEDVLLDGKTSAVFQWCLNNQQRHNSFLQQGLKVKKDICHNKGSEGMFEMTLNQSTHDLLKKTKRLTFVVKAYRKAVNVSFEVSDISTVFARLSGVGAKKTVAKKIPASTPVAKTSVVVESAPKPEPVVAAAISTPKPQPIKMCKADPPAGFSSIRPVAYRCDDDVAKKNARDKIATGVKKSKQAKLEKEKKEKLALERKRQLQQTVAEKEREASAISQIDQNTDKIRNEVSEKMISMCMKKWTVGEHRCYCESYLEFAPAGIKSDASCAGS